nr:ECF transporter S component [Clostridia bacterium]
MATTRTARKASIRTMAQLAILTAITLVMAFTPFGYLPIGLVKLSLLSIPVAVGAMIGGVKFGTFLGFIFGVTSFIQCFGMDAMGVLMMGINPFGTFIMTVVSRTLMGACTGLICTALKKVDRTHIAAYAVTGLSAALLNTLFFVAALVLFFGNNPEVQAYMGVDSVIAIITLIVTVNSLFEAIVSLIASTAIGKVLDHVIKPPKHEAKEIENN